MGTRTAARSKSKAKRLNRLRGIPPRQSGQNEKPADSQIRDESATYPSQPAASNPAAAHCQAEPANCHARISPEGTAIKQVAAAALVMGQNVRKTAQVLGVSRRTIQRW